MTPASFHPRKVNRSRILFWVIVLTLLLLAPSIWLLGEEAGTPLRGGWILEFHDDGWVELTLERTDRRRGHHWNSSDDFQVKDPEGLQRPPGADRVSAHFELRRDAGTLAFDGELDATGGAGRFAFAPNPEYVETLARMGYARPDTEELFSLAVHDVSRTYIRELAEPGHRRVSLEDLVAMKIHGVTLDYVKHMRGRFQNASPEDLVSMRIHGER
jgi:hypothetical protein